MTVVVHKTPGLIDLRAFTLMGVSAKPDHKNPIGQFGTGLKYSIAVAVRLGASPVVYIGHDRYEFYAEPEQFRGQAFQSIKMRPKKASLLRASPSITLPFSTNYGKNWVAWQIFRELEANTRDENGETFSHDGDLAELAGDGHTLIAIDHIDYLEAWQDREKIFLKHGLAVKEGSHAVQILEGESEAIYYRGMRARDTQKKTFMTYNILSALTLTEDRTLAYEHQVKTEIATHLLNSNDETLLERILTCSDSYWEHGLEFPSWVVPSDAFKAVIKRRPQGLWRTAVEQVRAHEPKAPPPPYTNLFDMYPRPWWVESNQIVDAKGTVILSRPSDFPGNWALMADDLIKQAGAQPSKKEKNAKAEHDDLI